MEDNQQAITNQPSPGTSSASVVKASQQPPQPGVSEPQQQRQHRPDSSNLPSNDSSANLLSNNSQLLETSSLRTNNSSDCIVTYDSDSCWPLSHGSSSSKFNATQGSAARLNGLDNPLEFESRDNNSIFNELDQRSESETQFTIGPMNDQNENMICMNHEDRQQLDQFDTLQLYDQDLEEDDGTYESHKQVIVGICAMAKKAQSKPMNEILRRLEDYFEYIKTLVFEESVILNKPIEEWPLCDCLISFHSKGFPLSKAIEYARLRRPFLVNDLDIQYDIQDRRKVYKILEEADIELPRYAVLDCDSPNPEDRELIESDDHIEVANVVFNKPFVEKPISAEDHNICIYYPAHAGGGSQRLFRKIGCRSSVYSNKSHVRKTGSYIYEEFMPTDGTDVKVYTAGPDYAHAEARKSPALDGKVERDSDGKEIRYPVILTNREKLIARKVCLAFKQTVCGFDLLRANGKSYVCDVNGFSFVKSSMKYYEDCSKILGNMMLRALAPQLHIPWSIPFQLDDPPIVPTTFGRMMELRCVIAVIRHGDRTPKQKMKLEVKHPKFFELYHKYENSKNGQAKVKKPKQLQEVLDIARYLLGELPQQPPPGEVVEPRVKLKQLKSVLEMYGHFSGINRKVQLKYQPHGRPRRSSSEDECSREPSLVLILKWGGELTPAGRVQAEDLGRCFRRLYPASGDYSGPQGLGLLRLHSTFRHDLKIYASDEGRVQMTAAAFAKGFLALEGELTPILFQMVKSANTNGLLDNDCESSKCQKIVKERLHNIMQKNQDLIEEDMKILNPTDAPSIEAACKFICNPYQACEKIYKLIKELNSLIRSKRQDNCYTQEYHLYHGETWDLLQRRWAKLEKDFKFPRSKRFDISKIPDIYDCIKYDLQHNQHTLQFQFAHELHTYAKALADIVIPQEYGMTAQEKLMIGLGTCSPLLRKIQSDLIRNSDSSNEDETESVNRLDPKYSHGVSSPDRHVRTRLYFTSESHIHSLVTALQFGGLLDVKKDEQWQRSMEFLSAISELNYLSQIVIMLYEDPTKEPTSDDRFHVEIHFSSGVINRISQQNMPTEPQGPGFRPHLQTKSYSNASTGATGANETDNDMSFDSVTIRARLNVSAMQQQQQQGTGMIKEEPTDDERSTDGDSRSHSKSSSICVTPKKSNVSGAESKQSIATLVPPVTASNGHSEESDVENNDTLTQTKVNRLTNRCPQRCLARSYSAVAPLSLQDLFKKDDKLVSSELESTDEQQADELSTSVTPTDNKPSLLSTCRINELNAAVNDENQKGQQPSLHSTEQTAASTATPSTQSSSSSSSTLRQHQPMADYSRLCTPTYEYCIPKSTSEMADNDQDVVADKVNVSENQQHQKRELQEEDSVDGNAATTTDNSARLNQTNDKPPKAQATPTTRVPDKKNWKTYEQYLASEMTNGGQLLHHHHHYRRRCQNQFDQQLVNLPPTYHTIHHWNYSPAHLNSVGKTSASMSTSPQQIGSYYNTNSLHQRYLAHKQQQQQQAAGNNKQQYFTLSASTPVHYKSMQNPRACSVADVSQYCGGPSLISTAVISGSSPELVAVCPYSPNIRPLETLHNELSLKQFIEFITRITRNHRSSNNPSSDSHHRHQAIADSRSEKADIEKGGSEGGSNEQQEGNLRSDNGDGDDTENSAQRDANSSNTANNSGFYLPTCGNNRHHQNNAPLGLSPGNSLSNSLIWSGPPSSFASSPGPSSPGPSSPASAALELWAKLELSESTNPESLNGSSGTALTATTTTPPHTTTTATTTTTTSASSSSSSTLIATAATTTTAAMTTAAATTTVDE